MEVTPEQREEMARLAKASTINPQHAQDMADSSVEAINTTDHLVTPSE